MEAGIHRAKDRIYDPVCRGSAVGVVKMERSRVPIAAQLAEVLMLDITGSVERIPYISDNIRMDVYNVLIEKLEDTVRRIERTL
jgi:hypothetical protein